MNQFQFNYLENQLLFNKQEIFPEQKFSTQYGGQGFNLESQLSHWIVFTVKPNTIKAFYKKVLPNEEIIYYQKELPKQEITNWEFTYLDIVEKVNGKWKYRNK